MKPPFPYFGGKQTMARLIVSMLPDHKHYVEPFAGSMAVLLAKPPSPVETINDLDSSLVTFWRVLRDREDELARAVELTPHSREESSLSRAQTFVPGDDLETARRVWVCLTQGRGGNLGEAATGWRYASAPSYGSAAKHLDGYRSRMPACARRIAHVSLENRPAVDVIAEYGQHSEALLYVDPPYVYSTRTKQSQRYGHEMTDEDHRQLAEVLRGAAAAVVLSGYPSPLYDELYAGWHRTELSASTSNGGEKRARTEVLWSNVPLGVQGDLLAEIGAVA